MRYRLGPFVFPAYPVRIPLRLLLLSGLVLLSACSHVSLPGPSVPPQPPASPPSAASSAARALATIPASQCPQFYVHGVQPQLPATPGLSQLREVCFDAYVSLYSGGSKTPVLVVEQLTRAQLINASKETRTNRFYPEARVPFNERAQLADYQGSGYDRGHQAPAGDMPTASAMAQSFSLANMVPQAPYNNQHAWAGIEAATRQYVMRSPGAVYVFTGPVFNPPIKTIGTGQVWVPSHLYKLVFDASNNRAWAHWIENTNEARTSAPITYAELVRRTGIEFLPSGVQVRD
jgi:endonuclease G, mitochondrial